MPDQSEIAALKASVRGALVTGEALAALRDRIDALDPTGDIPAADLETLARLSAAHATAAAALRGLVETIKSRRETSSAER
jgi:hypothetical protein